MRIVTFLLVICSSLTIAFGQSIERQDYIWARTSTSAITVDGVLSEAAWAKAESVQVVFGQTGLMPGGGWHQEGTPFPTDPTRATIKFLVWGDSLFVAVIVKDSSVGGGPFNRKDAFLMNLRDKAPTGSPGVFINSLYSRSFEFFYGWVTEGWADPATGAVGAHPGYFGFVSGHRDSIQGSRSDYSNVGGLVKRAIWDARTTVQGVANSDTAANGAPAYDEGYTTELKFNLALRGYNVTRPAGDTVMWSISIYDADWRWPIDSAKTTGNRVWLQAPFGNASQFGHMNLLVNPSVTTESGVLTPLQPDIRIPNGQNFPTPVIDGALDEQVWAHATSFKMEYGNDAVRNSYPHAGKYRSGHYQLPINGATAPVLDASVATVKYFFKGDKLYFGFDVADQIISFRPAADHRDGFRLTINDRAKLDANNNNLVRWDIRFYVDTVDHGGGRGRAGFLQQTLELDTLGAIKLGLKLKPNSTVDTLAMDPNQVDVGYTAELEIDLTKIGYPAGRGDGVAFFGVTHYDGDFFDPVANSYSIRSWFFRELQDLDGPAWAYMDPAYLVTTDIAGNPGTIPETFALMGNYPNPFNPSTAVQYTMPQPGMVTMYVFDMLGRKVATKHAGFQLPGVRTLEFSAGGLSSGTYFYHLEMASEAGVRLASTVTGKMLLLK